MWAAAVKTWRKCTDDEFSNSLGTRKDTIIGDANPKFQMHFATAREAFNIAMAAIEGHSGNPHMFRDHKLRPIMSDVA